MLIKDLPVEIQEYIKDYHKLYPLSCHRNGYLTSEFHWYVTPDGLNFWYDINNGNFKRFFDKYSKKIYTIQDLANGKCAVINDGTKGELKEVLNKAFPKDRSAIYALNRYYYSGSNHKDNWFFSNSLPGIPVQSVKDFIKQLDMGNKKIIGYKAPIDLFRGNYKKGTIYIIDTGDLGFMYKPKDSINKSKGNLPGEIVETWEPVYEEKVEIVITSEEGEFTVEIKPGFVHYANETYRIADLRTICDKGYHILGSNSRTITCHISEISVGCKTNISIKDVKRIIELHDKKFA